MEKFVTSSKTSIGSCNECIHIIGKCYAAGKCQAFPNGIPKEIFWNSHSHIGILPEQIGEYVFEMKERYKKVYEKIEASKKINDSDKTHLN